MDSRGIQVKELSAKTGISENTIKSYLKSASSEPKISKAISIARALGVSVEYLATGEREQTDGPFQEYTDLCRIAENFSRKELKILLALAKAIDKELRH